MNENRWSEEWRFSGYAPTTENGYRWLHLCFETVSMFCFIVLRDIYPVRNCFPGASSTDVLFEWGET